MRMSSHRAAAPRERADRELKPTFSGHACHRDAGRAAVGIGIGGHFAFAGGARCDGHPGHEWGAQRATADRDAGHADSRAGDAGSDSHSNGDPDPQSDAFADAVTFADANARRLGDTRPDHPASLGPGHTVPDALPDRSANGHAARDSHTDADTEPDTGDPDTRDGRRVPGAGAGRTDLLHRNARLRERCAGSRRVCPAQHRDHVSRGERRAGRVARSRRR